MKLESREVKIESLKPHPKNPRFIKDDKFEKLKKSLETFEEMTNVRPLVCNKKGEVLGGNMRLRAMQELGWETVLVYMVDWDEKKQSEFMIKDNANYGEWDYDQLANEWANEELIEWGVDVWVDPEEDAIPEERYSAKIEAPTYKITGEKPETNQLCDSSKTDMLISKIKEMKLADKELEEFLIKSAYRHTVFHYKNIAEYYAHSAGGVQEIMESLALVIIDFNQAIEDGYTMLSDEIIESYKDQVKDEEKKE